MSHCASVLRLNGRSESSSFHADCVETFGKIEFKAQSKVIESVEMTFCATNSFPAFKKYKFSKQENISCEFYKVKFGKQGFTLRRKTLEQARKYLLRVFAVFGSEADENASGASKQKLVSKPQGLRHKLLSEASDGFTATDKALSEASDGLPATDRMLSEASDGFTATDKLLSETSDALPAIDRTLSEASDGLPATDKALSEASDGLPAIDRALSEASDGFTATDKVLSEASDGLSAIDKALSETSDTSTAIDGTLSEASDGLPAIDKALSEASDGFTVTDKALSESSDGFTAIDGVQSEASDAFIRSLCSRRRACALLTSFWFAPQIKDLLSPLAFLSVLRTKNTKTRRCVACIIRRQHSTGY